MMNRIIYWLQRKKRIKEKRCGQCCLTCPYYKECSGEGLVDFLGSLLIKSQVFFEENFKKSDLIF